MNLLNLYCCTLEVAQTQPQDAALSANSHDGRLDTEIDRHPGALQACATPAISHFVDLVPLVVSTSHRSHATRVDVVQWLFVTSRVVSRPATPTDDARPNLRPDLDLWARLVADPEAAMESWVDRGGRAEHAAGANGPARVDQVSLHAQAVVIPLSTLLLTHSPTVWKPCPNSHSVESCSRARYCRLRSCLDRVWKRAYQGGT